MNRKENINRLKTEEFDVCIIGAGASGAGCALDAQLRGFKVALIEQEDFAAKTSSQSTKLIHGGVRYLEQAFKNFDFGQLRQVKHGLEERATLLRIAPHLAHPLALLTPCYSWLEGLYYAIGLRLYGFFAKKDVMPHSRWLNQKATFERIPNLNSKIHSSILYYDGQFDDARFCLSLAKTANQKGACLANHLQVVDFEKDEYGKLKEVYVEDLLGKEKFSIKAKHFINCTGAAADKIRLMANADLSPRIQKSKGSHVIIPLKILGNQNTALLIPKTKDDRVVFAIPWENKLLLGTTDSPYKNDDTEPKVNRSEAEFLIETLNRYLNKNVDIQEVEAGFSGLRPLIQSIGKETKQLLRDHVVEYDEISGLVSLMGGKWTTYRLMAKDAIDEICNLTKNENECVTENQLLAGAENYNFEDWKTLTQIYSIEEDIAKHLMLKYGVFAEKVLKNRNDYYQRLSPTYPYIFAEVLWHIQEEMAMTLEDALSRRLRLAFLDWKTATDVANSVANLMATQLDWTEDVKQKNIDEFINSFSLE